MKIVHIFKNTNEKFSEPFIEFINSNFEKSENNFIILGKDNRFSKDNKDNVKFMEKKISYKLLVELYSADKIILHSLMSPFLVVLLFLQPWLLKKCYWIVWGSDLYYYNFRKITLKTNIFEIIRKVVIRNIGNVCTLVKGDYSLAKEYYNIKGKYFKALYTSDERTKSIQEIINHPKYFDFNNETTRIIVGNSATPTNNHIDILDILKKFKDENIEIICPMSYGDMEYAKKVILYGKEIFNNKFISLNEFMSMKEYMEYLSEVDIGIFNNNRQQGLGNIYSMLFLGKKVFVKNGTTMWDEFKDEMGLNIYDINDIQNENFEVFKSKNSKLIDKNIQILERRYNNKYIKDIWSEILYR